MSGDAAGPGSGFAQGVVEVVGLDLERSLAFYLSLGFELLRRTGPFAVIHWQGQRLLLAEDANAAAGKRWTNLRIMVADVDAIWKRVNELGLPCVNPIGDRFYGLRDFVVADPDGFDIRFAQSLPA